MKRPRPTLRLVGDPDEHALATNARKAKNMPVEVGLYDFALVRTLVATWASTCRLCRNSIVPSSSFAWVPPREQAAPGERKRPGATYHLSCAAEVTEDILARGRELAYPGLVEQQKASQHEALARAMTGNTRARPTDVRERRQERARRVAAVAAHAVRADWALDAAVFVDGGTLRLARLCDFDGAPGRGGGPTACACCGGEVRKGESGLLVRCRGTTGALDGDSLHFCRLCGDVVEARALRVVAAVTTA